MSGSKIQHSILGRIKAKLSMNDRVKILDKWFPQQNIAIIVGQKLS